MLLTDDAAFLQDLRNIPKTFLRPFFPATPRGETYYRPLITTTFILDAQWGGVAPRAFHVTNILLHVLATGLLVVFLHRLGVGAMMAALAATFFAVHPALTEAVAWIPGRCDLLLGVGFLVSAIALLQMADGGGGRAFAVHLTGLEIALLSKEAALAIPAVLAGLLWLEPQGRALLRRTRLWVGWALAIAVWVALRSSLGTADANAGDRLRVAFEHASVPLMHLGKVVFPRRLAVLAYAPDTDWTAGAVAVVALAALGLAVRGARLYWWGIATLVAFILPTLPVSDFLILENRLYVPAIGLVTALAVAGAEMLSRKPEARPLAALATGVALVAASWTTLRYSTSFRDPEAFTEAAIRASPHLGLAHLNRGIVLQVNGRQDEARAHYLEAVALDPDLTITHNNLGLIAMARGDIVEAERLLRREIQTNPSYDKAHFNLGLALARQGRLADAAGSWREALRLNSGNAEARTNLDRAEALLGVHATTLGAQDADKVPTEALLSLFRDALHRQPTNDAIRAAYRDLCRKRGVACPDP